MQRAGRMFFRSVSFIDEFQRHEIICFITAINGWSDPVMKESLHKQVSALALTSDEPLALAMQLLSSILTQLVYRGV